MRSDSGAGDPLPQRPTERAFVIQFEPMRGARRHFRGRVELVATGDAIRFRSLKQLVGFLTGTLRSRAGLFLAAVLSSLILAPSRALAIHPGINGQIAYTDILDAADPQRSRRAIFLDGIQFTTPIARPSYQSDSDSSPAWSADGKQLAFVRLDGATGQHGIYVVDADGLNLTRIFSTGQPLANGQNHPLRGQKLDSLAWSYDALQILFVTDSLQVWAVDPTATDTQPGYVVQGLPPAGPFLRHLDTGPEGTLTTCYDNTNRICHYRRGSGLSVATRFASYVVDLPLPNDVLFYLTPGAPRSYTSGQLSKIAFSRQLIRSQNVPPDPAPILLSPNELFRAVYGPSGAVRDVRRITAEPAHLIRDCPNRPGTTETRKEFRPQYEYFDPVPSPNGRFVLTLRLENIPGFDDDGYCTMTQERRLWVLDEISGEPLRMVGSGPAPADAAWQPSPVKLAVNVTDGVDRPLDGLRVELRNYADPGVIIAIEPRNVAGGTYLFEGAIPAGEFLVRVTLTEKRGEAFEIRHGWPASEPVWVDRRVLIPPDTDSVEIDFPIEDSTEVVNTNISADGTLWDRLDDVAAIYFEMERFATWVRANLTANTGRLVPLYTFATSGPLFPLEPDGGYYEWRVPGANSLGIFLGTTTSDFQNRAPGILHTEAPENGEWHEFVHHLEHEFILPDFACLDDPPHEPHAGWTNASTCDSLVEGLASFLPTLVEEDPFYANFPTSLEAPQRAWDNLILWPTVQSAEDRAVTHLLWDLVDADPDQELALGSSLGDLLLVPFRYTDEVRLPLATLWQILTTRDPKTVFDLQRALVQDAGPALTSLSVDLDQDGINDVSAIDSVFLMHGFFPVVPFGSVAPQENVYRYDVDAARAGGRPSNNDVGLSSHSLPLDPFGLAFRNLLPRLHMPRSESSSLAVQTTDASGTPLRGAVLELTLESADSTSTTQRSLPTGEGDLVHLELPTYFDYFLPEGAPLPDCDPATDRTVSVTARATINGYTSNDAFSIDNCTYWHAVLAAQGDVAAATTLRFPEDSTAPLSSLEPLTSGRLFGNYAVGAWTVEVSCQDPVSGGFASGCQRSEYSLDGAPFAPYVEPVEISEPGLHSFAYRSLDAAGNQEPTRSADLGVVGADEYALPVTTLTAVASEPPVAGYTAGFWTVSLLCSDALSGAAGSACLRSEYGIDGGPLATYQAPFLVAGPGNHVVRYRSLDVLGNEEVLKVATLGVLGPDTTPPLTEIRLDSTGPRALYDDRVMGSWSVALESCQDFRPASEVASGCARSEFRLDGGAFQPFDRDVVVAGLGVHSFEYRSIDTAGNVESTRQQTLEVVSPSDLDADGVLDYGDNCHVHANPDQRDTDGDLYGNRCDADFNRNGTVDSNDASLLKARLGTSAASSPDQDLDGNGVVDVSDANILKAGFRRPPGPAYGYDRIQYDE